MKGLVMKSTGSWYLLKDEEGALVEARIRGKFRLDKIKHTNPIAVGDWVIFLYDDTQQAVIQQILPRKNYIIRKSVNLSKRTHIIASNIDTAFLVISVAQPATSMGFIDRFLITAEAYQIPVVILINKIDLYNEVELIIADDIKSIYEKIGYTCKMISVEKNINLDWVRNQMKDKVSMVSGHSGVGKSTLINILNPLSAIKTGIISTVHLKGQHTTTFAEMHSWSFGGYIIDTPGIKELGLVDMNKYEIQNYFPELFALKSECKFQDCLHINEPSCAVLMALEKENIADSRYASYTGFMTDIVNEL